MSSISFDNTWWLKNKTEDNLTSPYKLRSCIVRNTSGAIQRGVPTQISGGGIPIWEIQQVCKKERRGIALSKSQSLTTGVPSAFFLSKSIKMFSLFISRWIISLECSSASACATSLAICNVNSSWTFFSPALNSFCK